MTLDEAALSLRDDPSFALMSPEEREEEAATLLGSDDPLDIALAIEAALQPSPETVAVAAAVIAGTIEGCRNATDENPAGCGGREPIAANGRCMVCGAHRGVQDRGIVEKAPAEPIQREVPVLAMQVAPTPEIEPSEAPAKDFGTFLARFKAVTGSTDKELGAMLGVSRSAMHAYVTGFLPEKVTQAQRAIMAGDIVERLVLLTALERDLNARIGEIE